MTADGDEISLNDDSIGEDISDDEEDILLDDDNIGDNISDDDEGILLDDDSISLDDDAEIIDSEEDDILLDEADNGDTINLAEEDDILLDDDDILIEDTTAAVDMVVAKDNEAWAQTGGWYRDGSNIKYRPIGHADPFLRSWLDISSKQSNPQEILLFKSLGKEKSVGNCTKCHSVEIKPTASQIPELALEQQPATNDAQNKIHWQSFKPGNVAVDFNRFSHTAHFSLMTDDGCSSCHLLNTNAEATTEQAVSFVDMDKKTCTECHRQGRAPDNCLTCHNYHVEPRIKLIEQISDLLWGNNAND